MHLKSLPLSTEKTTCRTLKSLFEVRLQRLFEGKLKRLDDNTLKRLDDGTLKSLVLIVEWTTRCVFLHEEPSLFQCIDFSD